MIMKRVLSIILVAVMCLSLMPAVLVSAADENTSGELVNLFTTTENGGVGVRNSEGRSDVAAGYGSNSAYWCTEPIAVTPADTIYLLGDTSIGYHFSLFGKDGAGLGKSTNIKASGLTLVETVGSTFGIYSYTPAENVGYVRISQKNAVYLTGCVLATKNQPFTAAEFKLWCAKNDGDYYKLTGENFVNLFTTTEKGGVGVINAEGRSDTNNYPAGYGKNTAYWCTEAIPVTTADTLYFLGESGIGYHISLFDQTGAGLGSSTNVKPAHLTVFDEVGKNEETGITYSIYSYTPAENVGFVRISQKDGAYKTGCIVLTKNQPFGKATLESWCDANGGNLNKLLGILDPSEVTGLNNLFTTTGKGGVGILNAEGRSDLEAGHGTNTSYWCTEPIAVTPADTIYFLGDTTIGYHISLFDANGAGLGKATNVLPADLKVVEKLGAGVYNIYSYTPAENVGFIRISQKSAVYASSCVLVTKNQPFDKAKLAEWCTANGGDLTALVGEELPEVVVDTESPLYQKSALFIGDSITYGLGEERFNPNMPRRAWAGRLAEKYAMTVVNAGDSGARISMTGSSGYIIDGLYKWTEATAPDMVVMHGGVNDARYNEEVPLGTINSTDGKTFCGGLNRLFNTAKQKYPNAALFYIANFYIPENKGNVSNMTAYYDLAKQICDKFGVVYIDLAGNMELNKALADVNADNVANWNTYMPDMLHPNAAGYDIITPYIAAALEDYYKNPPKQPDENPDDDPTEDPDGKDPTDGTTTAATTTVAPGTTVPSTTTAPEKERGCGSFTAIGAVLALLAVTGAAIVIKKK